MTKKTKEELLKELESLKERLNELENADLEQKKVIETLRESEAKYRLLFDAAPVGIGIADLEGNIIDANINMQEMSGYSLDEYRAIGVGATYADPEERKILLKSLREKGKVRDWEGRLKRKDGSEYDALLNADIMELGSCKVILGIIRDISERKRIDEALNAALANAQDEKNKSEAIIAALGDGIIIQDTDYKIIYQNQIQNDLYGDRTGELCYRTYERNDKICEDCPVERTFRDGKIHRSEKKVPTDNGDSYFELTSSPLKDSTGKIIAGIKIVRDITASKRAEEKLREGEQFLESIFASIQDGIGVIDGDMNIIRVNKTAENWYPYAAPLVGKKCYEAYHSRNERCEQCPAWETLKTGTSAYKVVPKHGPEGKEVGWLEIYSYPLTDTKTGQLRGVIEYVRDITERKQAEEAIRSGNERLSLAQEVGKIGSFEWLIQDNKTIWTKQMETLYGLQHGGFGGKNELWEKMLHPEDHDRVMAQAARAMSERKDIETEFRIIWQDGSVHWILDKARTVYSDTGKPLRMVGVNMDITERKRAEEELKQSEEKYRLLIENIQEGVFVIQDAKMVFVNQAFAEIAGYSIEEIIGNDFYHFVAPDDLEMVKDRYYRRQKGENVPKEYEFHALRKNGEKPVVNMNVGIVTYRGRVASMGILRDITEQKRVEKLIKRSEEKYRNLVELTTDIIYVTDKDRKHVFMNDAGYRILEAEPEEVIGHHWSECVYPDDREKSFKKFREQMVKGIDVFDFENRYFSKSGKAINVLHNVRVLRNEKGEVIGTQGIARDITERMRIEKSLKLFSEAVESAPDGIQIVDSGGHIKYSNKAFEKIYGFSQDELTGKNVGSLNVDPEIAGKVIIPGTLEKGSWTGELIVRHKDGHEFPIWLTTSLVKDETGAPIAMVGIIRDITERKRAQEALRLSNLVVENSLTVLFRWKAQEGWPVEFVSNNVVQFGYSQQDFISGELPYSTIVHPDDLERVSREVQEHSESGDSRFQQEYRIIGKDGAVHWIDDRTVIERNRDGQITNYQGIIIDITERKHAEEAIRKYNLELEESNRIQELFTDIMHHDLLNPINVAHGYVELFLEDETNPLKKSYLETIKRNLLKGMELIDNAQKFSKLESMKNIEFQNLDLKTVVTEAIDNLSPLAMKAKIRVENGLKDKMPARANKIIEDVFANLVSNAIKYAPHGKKIVVDGKEVNSSWMIRVVDFGPGIKDVDKKLIFERFQRKNKKGVKGSGLGLAIARKIVELHNGRIWVEDNPEGGAVFVVEIPKSES